MGKPVTIIMIEDDEGHARLIERNIRRSGVNNEIMPFTNGTAAVKYLFGANGTGIDHKGQALLILLDQVSRNLYRSTAEAFAADAKARAVARAMLARGFQGRFPLGAPRAFSVRDGVFLACAAVLCVATRVAL